MKKCEKRKQLRFVDRGEDVFVRQCEQSPHSSFHVSFASAASNTVLCTRVLNGQDSIHILFEG